MGNIIHEGRFRRGILFMREDFVGEYYSRGKISSGNIIHEGRFRRGILFMGKVSLGNIIHEGRFRRGILFMRDDFVGEYYSRGKISSGNIIRQGKYSSPSQKFVSLPLRIFTDDHKYSKNDHAMYAFVDDGRVRNVVG